MNAPAWNGEPGSLSSDREPFPGPDDVTRFWEGYNQAVKEGWSAEYVAMCRREGSYVPPIFRVAPQAARAAAEEKAPQLDTLPRTMANGWWVKESPALYAAGQ